MLSPPGHISCVSLCDVRWVPRGRSDCGNGGRGGGGGAVFGISGGGDGREERGGCTHRSRNLRVKAACSIRRKGSDYGGGGGGGVSGGGLVAVVMVLVVVVSGKEQCSAATALPIAVLVDPVDRFSASIAFELISRARGGGGDGGGSGGRWRERLVVGGECSYLYSDGSDSKTFYGKKDFHGSPLSKQLPSQNAEPPFLAAAPPRPVGPVHQRR